MRRRDAATGSVIVRAEVSAGAASPAGVVKLPQEIEFKGPLRWRLYLRS